MPVYLANGTKAFGLFLGDSPPWEVSFEDQNTVANLLEVKCVRGRG